MPFKCFDIKSGEFDKRGRTLVQHKLRVLLKCYTVYDFSLNDIDQTFEFKKSYKIRSVKRKDPKQLSGRYELEDIEGKTILKLWVN